MAHPLRARLDRRQLIQLAGIVSAGALLPAVTGCSSVVRRDVTGEPAGASALPDPLAAILHDAALAPSSHNSQPWRVAVHDPARLSIYADLGRRLADVDPADRELRLSLGAFVENLVTSAAARGRACRIDVASGDDLRRPIADVELSVAPRTTYPLERLPQRCTVRRGLRSAALPRAVVSTLLATEPSAVSYLPGDGPVAAAIREATLAAFQQQTDRDSAQRELARWTRFSNDAVRSHRDGLTTASMGITGLSGWYVRNFYDADDVMASSFRRSSIELASSQVREAAGWFVVTSRDQRPDSILDAGRAYQRLALLAREHRLGLHPMSQSLEEEPYRSQLVGRLDVGGVPQFIVRAGSVDVYPEPATLRRPVASFASFA